MDDAANGVFLPNRKSKAISALTRHQGGHTQYTNVISDSLNDMDSNKSVPKLEMDVFRLQMASRDMMEAGNPIYPIDYVPTPDNSKSSIWQCSEVINGADSSTRTEEFIRSFLYTLNRTGVDEKENLK